MKVIDLLNKIANGKRPEKIKYKDKVYNWDKNVGNYILEYNKNVSINWDFVSMFDLDNEVEIIEEDKKIEKLDTKDLFTCDDYQNIRLNFGLTWSKINEIIDYINGGIND